MLPRAHVVPRPPASDARNELLTPAQSYQRPSSAADESNMSAVAARAIRRSTVSCSTRLAGRHEMQDSSAGEARRWRAHSRRQWNTRDMFGGLA